MRNRRGRDQPPRRWTKAELRTLTMSVGAFGRDYLCRHVQRTPGGVYAQIARQFGGGGIGRGTISLAELSERTGYTERQLRRAGLALGQRWQRTSSTGRHMLSDDQGEALVRWLAHDYWCGRLHLYACVYCGRDDARPQGLGVCQPCYRDLRRWFREARVKFSRDSLLELVHELAAGTPVEERDWLLAFEASLEDRCVLTRGTVDRLLEAATEVRRFGCRRQV